MSGWIRMHRGWADNEVFADEPYSERDAWVWLIENAAWRPGKVRVKGHVVELQRGQLCFAQRFLAEKWQWSKSRVDRFLKRLAANLMIETCSKSGATAGHSAGQGQSIITICNYDKYQADEDAERGNTESTSGATAGQQRGKEEEVKKDKKKEEEVDAGTPASGYAFEGATIRLNEMDLARWRRTYFAIADLEAELSSIDAWFQDNPPKLGKWFHPASGMLNRKHQELLRLQIERPKQPAVPL